VDPDNACGLTVAVQAQTTPDLEEIPARSEVCTAAGKAPIEKLKFDNQDAATSAVVTGRVSAFVADSPVTQYQVKNSKGKLQLAGDVYDVVLYGMPIAKENADLGDAMVKALESLEADGTYQAILEKYGVATGAVSTFGVNGAKN
jgi:polar amino acid transport system substrate-binding protein